MLVLCEFLELSERKVCASRRNSTLVESFETETSEEVTRSPDLTIPAALTGCEPGMKRREHQELLRVFGMFVLCEFLEFSGATICPHRKQLEVFTEQFSVVTVSRNQNGFLVSRC